MVPPGNSTNLNAVTALHQAIPSLHGHGPVEVSIGGFPTPLDRRVIGTTRAITNITASQALAGEGGTLVKGGDQGFGFNEDYIQGGVIGFSSYLSLFVITYLDLLMFDSLP